MRVEDAGEAGQIYDRPDRFIASANFAANESDRGLWLWHPLPMFASQTIRVLLAAGALTLAAAV